MILTIQAALEKHLRNVYDINTRMVEYVETPDSLDVVFREGDHSVTVHLPWAEGERMTPRYDLYLTGVNAERRIASIKALRTLKPQLGLKEAKDISDELHNGVRSRYFIGSFASVHTASAAAQPLIDAECFYMVDNQGVP